MSDLDDDPDEFDVDLGDCPYLARFHALPGHDPQGICAYGCYDEPACITCEPNDGWPKMHAAIAALSIDTDGVVLVCIRVVGGEDPPLPDAVVGQCTSCRASVWVSASSPEAAVKLCVRCAPVILAMRDPDDPTPQFLDTLPAQRASLLAAGVPEGMIAASHAVAIGRLQQLAEQRRRHHD